jgi:hypothetical protein
MLDILQLTVNSFFLNFKAMFNTYIGNMRYLKYFFRYVHYVFFGFMFIGIIFAVLELIYRLFIKNIVYRFINNILQRDEPPTKNFHSELNVELNKQSGFGLFGLGKSK